MFCVFLDNFDTFYKKKIDVKTKKSGAAFYYLVMDWYEKS